MTRPVVFLDRDGTLNDDPGYLADPTALRLFDGVAQAVARLKDAGFATVVVTNQSGVGRGLITPEGLDAVHRRLRDLLDGRIDGIYACHHHPTQAQGAFKKVCSCRKPATGMLEQAVTELDLTKVGSYMIGDSPADLECGRTAGLVTVLVRTGQGRKTLAAVDRGELQAPDHVVDDLPAAAEWILGRGEA